MSGLDLKACAHCGGEAKRGLSFGRDGVRCTACPVSIRGDFQQSFEEVAAAWNLRAPLNTKGVKPVAWTREKPTVTGAYWVRGWAVGSPKEEALVHVWKTNDTDLMCNLHEENSDTGAGNFLTDLDEGFEWLGPLFALPAGQEKV